MKQYEIITNNGLPNAEIHNFTDTVESGVVVVQLSNGVYYIDKSNFIAKTLRQWSMGVGLNNDYIFKNPPVRFVEKFILYPTKTRRYGSAPEHRFAMQQFENAFVDSIYFRYLEQYGHTKVKTPHWLQYGVKGHESKTEFVDNQIHQVDYLNILGEENGKPKRKKSA